MHGCLSLQLQQRRSRGQLQYILRIAPALHGPERLLQSLGKHMQETLRSFAIYSLLVIYI
ncbi:hypothetical protein D3C80_1831080 [compost metagenome]